MQDISKLIYLPNCGVRAGKTNWQRTVIEIEISGRSNGGQL
jgi:hypothetical protein